MSACAVPACSVVFLAFKSNPKFPFQAAWKPGPRHGNQKWIAQISIFRVHRLRWGFLNGWIMIRNWKAMSFYMAPRVWRVLSLPAAHGLSCGLFFGFVLIVLDTVSSRREDNSSLCFLSLNCAWVALPRVFLLARAGWWSETPQFWDFLGGFPVFHMRCFISENEISSHPITCRFPLVLHCCSSGVSLFPPGFIPHFEGTFSLNENFMKR